MSPSPVDFEGYWDALPQKAFGELLKFSLISGVRKQFTVENESNKMISIFSKNDCCYFYNI